MNHTYVSRCPLCSSENNSVLETLSRDDINKLYLKAFGIEDAVKNEHLSYLNCSNCGLYFFDPVETGSEHLYERLQTFDWYYMTNKYEYEIAMKYLPDVGAVLEVGAGKAAFAEKVGFERYMGLEFNDKALERARQVGVHLVKQSVEAHAESGNTYDAVVSFQVLEHVSDPAGFIRGCVQCLKPGGRLIIGVPAHDSIAGASVNNILDMPPHHVTHWTGETLSNMSTLFGLELLAIEYEPIAEYHRPWMSNIIWETRLRHLFRMPSRLLDISLLSRLVSRLAAILTKTMPVSIDGLNGHTVVAAYRKK